MRGEAKIDLQGRLTGEGTFEFSFDVTEDRRKAEPYACRLVLDEDGTLVREHFDLDEDDEGRNVVRVSGEYEAKAGDLIEECSGGSWKNEYVVSPTGEKVCVYVRDAEVRKYLRGKLQAVDLVPEHYPDVRAKLTDGSVSEPETRHGRPRLLLVADETADVLNGEKGAGS